MGVLCDMAKTSYEKACRLLVRIIVATVIATSLFTINNTTAYADGGSLLDKIEYPIYKVRTGSNLRETPSIDGRWLMNVPKGAYVVLMDGKQHGNYYHVRYGAYDGYLYCGSIVLDQNVSFSDYRQQFPELYGNEKVAESVDKAMADDMKELRDKYYDMDDPDYEALEDIVIPAKKTPVIQMYTRENALNELQHISITTSNIKSLKERDGGKIEQLYQTAQEIRGIAVNRAKIRNVPSIEGEQIATINTDDIIVVIDSGENGYLHVKFGDVEGFIYSRCVDYDTSLLDDSGLSIIDTVILGELAQASEESKNYEQYLVDAEQKARESEVHDASVSLSQEITTTATMEPQTIITTVDAVVSTAGDDGKKEKEEPDTTRLKRRTNLRTLPDNNSNNITTLPAGTDVIVIGEAVGGYKMVQYNGMTGYILDNTVVNTVDVSKLGGEAVLFTCTAYCSCKRCCGSYSPEVRGGVAHTATGTVPAEGRTIAVDPSVIPYGTKVYIDGMGVYTAEDCGGAIKGNHIDIYFDTHEGAVIFGTKRLYVTIVK